MRYARFTLLGLGLLTAGKAEGQKIHEKYDAFTDRTTAILPLLFDSPLFGSSKDVYVLYSFAGKTQTAPPDSALWMVKLTSVGTADISAGGWKLSDRPPLYWLVDDTLRLMFPVITSDWNTGTISRLGYSLNEVVAYAIPAADLQRIAAGSKVAFKVGPWQRQLKDKELGKLRVFTESRLNK